jgi:Glucodextranase, domain B
MNRNAVSVLRISLVALLGIIIVGYSAFQAQKLLSGPIIDVYNPQNGATYNQALIEIDGRARNIAYINLDDRPIFTDKDGYFKEKILLSPGYNVIKLDARDKFKKYTEKKLEIILKEY